MDASIRNAIGDLQRIAPRISAQRIQFEKLLAAARKSSPGY
jgi:hypothetical protein